MSFAVVQAGQGVQLWAQGLRQQMYLGDDDFVLRMQALASDSIVSAISAKEIPKTQRASPKSLQDWLALCPTRVQALVQAHYASSQISLSQIDRAPVGLVGLARQPYRVGAAGIDAGGREGAVVGVGKGKKQDLTRTSLLEENYGKRDSRANERGPGSEYSKIKKNCERGG